MTSFNASEKRRKCRGAIGTPLSERPETRSNSTLSVPKKFANVLRTARLRQPWPEGWSGNGGVTSAGVVTVAAENKGSQFGSAIVRGLPSVSASRIAALGRQKFQ